MAASMLAEVVGVDAEGVYQHLELSNPWGTVLIEWDGEALDGAGCWFVERDAYHSPTDALQAAFMVLAEFARGRC